MDAEGHVRRDEAALWRDLAGMKFKLGQRRGKWALAGLAFPHVFFRVTAPPRSTGPALFLLRLECSGYRATGPTGCLWDGTQGAALAEALKPKRPDGNTVVGFSAGCGQAIYHPIDRNARAHWASNLFTEVSWGPDSDITSYLEVVHALLHDSEYVSSAASDAAAFLPDERLDPAA